MNCNCMAIAVTGLYYCFICGTLCGMKITELRCVSKGKIGRYHKNGIKPEPHEEETAKLLVLYGFDIEIIKPMNTPKTKNPDFLINGSIWETKSPTTSNLKTIKKRMHEASEQAMRVIVDLRRVRNNYNKIHENDTRYRCRRQNSINAGGL